MLSKRTLSITFLVLSILAFCLHASPIRRAVGDKATATLSKLDSTLTFTQVNDENVSVTGQLKKGIDKDEPDNYFAAIAVANASFSQLGIKIKVPGTEPFNLTGPGILDIIIGLPVKISYKDTELDEGVITKS